LAETVGPLEQAGPAGWVRFHMLRGTSNPDEVITFGFFDGTLEEVATSQRDLGYQERRAAVDALVQEVIDNGVYEVVQTRIAEPGPRTVSPKLTHLTTARRDERTFE
jgi:hypothetical protein